jgi:subtilisin family serine protease
VQLTVQLQALRPGFTRLDFRVESIQLFYDQAPAPMAINAGLSNACSFPNAVAASGGTGPVVLAMEESGLAGIASFQVPDGPLTEIRLVIDSPVLTRDVEQGTLKGQLRCKGEKRPAAEDVLRLVPSAPIDLVGGTATLKILFDPNRDIFTGEVGAQDGNQGNGGGNRKGKGKDGDTGNSGVTPAAPGLRLAGNYTLELIPPENDLVIPDHVIVRFKSGVPADVILAKIHERAATIRGEWRATNEFLLKLPDGSNLAEAIQFFEGLDEVAFALPNIRVRPPMTPNDPGFAQQTPWQQIKAPDAWNTTTGSAQVLVALSDTGYDLTHPDLIDNWFVNKNEVPPIILESVPDRNGNGFPDPLDLDLNHDGVITFRELNDPANAGVCPSANHAPFDRCDPLDLVNGGGRQRLLDELVEVACAGAGSISYGWQDGIDGDCNGLIDDVVGWNFPSANNLPVTPASVPGGGDHTHGTKTAGVVGAAGNNGIALAGVNWNVRMLPIRAYGEGATGTFEHVQAMRYAEDLGADVTLVEAFFFVARDGAAGLPTCAGLLPNVSEGKYNELRDRLFKQFADFQQSRTLVVSPAGNCNVNIDRDDLYQWPSTFNSGPSGLRVTGVQADDGRDTTVSFGQSRIDIAAPSQPQFIALNPNGGTSAATFSGTSSASAFVAGAAALVLSTDLSQRGNSCALADRIIRNANIVPALAAAQVDHGRRLDLSASVTNATSAPVRTCP